MSRRCSARSHTSGSERISSFRILSSNIVLLTPAALPKLGLSHAAMVLDLTMRVRYRGCEARGCRFDQVGRQDGCPSLLLLPLVRCSKTQAMAAQRQPKK
jgi:hypothetical protein